jgi:hypothetical protein
VATAAYGGGRSYEALTRRLVHRGSALGRGDRVSRSREDDSPSQPAHRADDAARWAQTHDPDDTRGDDDDPAADDPDDSEPTDDSPAPGDDTDHRESAADDDADADDRCTGLRGRSDVVGSGGYRRAAGGDEVLFVGDAQLDADAEVG